MAAGALGDCTGLQAESRHGRAQQPCIVRREFASNHHTKKTNGLPLSNSTEDAINNASPAK